MRHRAVADQPTTSPLTPPDELSPSTWRLLCVAATLCVWIALYVAQVSGSQFFADDFLYLQLARNGSIDLAWFTIGNYGHFAPITRLAYLLLERFGDLDYRLAALVPATLGALVFLPLTWIGRSLLGRRAVVLILALLGATSLPLLHVALWWGAAVHVLGAAVCMTVCVAGFIAYCGRRSRIALAVSVAALATGLLVQERPLVTIGYLVLIRYLFELDDRPREWRSFSWLVREARLWTPFAAVTVSYLVYRLFFFDSPPTPGSAHEGLVFFASGTVRSYLPSLVGVRSAGDAGWWDAPTALGLLLLVLTGAYIAARRRGVWRCVAFLVATYTVNIALVAAGRLGVGNATAQSFDLQYFVDVHIATVLTVLLGLGALPSRQPSTAGWRRVPGRLMAAVLAAVLASTAVQWHSMVTNNQGTVAHQYLFRARSELEHRKGDFDLLRFTVPRLVAPAFIDPYTDQPAIFSLIGYVREHLSPTSPTKLVVVGSGNVRSAHPVTLAEIPGGSARIEAGIGSPVRVRAADGASCLTGRRGGVVTVTLPEVVRSEELFFQIGYSARSPIAVRASTADNAVAAYNSAPTSLPGGDHVSVVDRLDGQDVRSVSLTLLSRVRDLCIDRFWLGTVAADDGAGCHVLDHSGRETGEPADCTTQWRP